jgi:hypothetical protein
MIVILETSASSDKTKPLINKMDNGVSGINQLCSIGQWFTIKTFRGIYGSQEGVSLGALSISHSIRSNNQINDGI